MILEDEQRVLEGEREGKPGFITIYYLKFV